MGGFVADASVSVSWVARAQATETTDRLSDQMLGGASLHIPALWLFEVSNVLLTLLRRGKLTPEEYQQGRSAMADVECSLDREAELQAFTVTADFAARFGLTVYDAAYLELAHRLQLPLATRDVKLLAAAESLGLQAIDAR